MRSLLKKMRTAERLQLELQSELLGQGVSLDNCAVVSRLCNQSYEEGFKAGLKQTSKEAEAKPNGKPKEAKPDGKSNGKRREVVTVTPESRVNAAAGRAAVANGDRPPARDAMVTVMGNKTMDAKTMVAALEAKGWLPSSSDPRQYVSFLFSSNCPDTFERTEKRGHYRVAKGASVKKKKPAAPKSRPGPKDAGRWDAFIALWKAVRRRRGPFTSKSLAETLNRRAGQVSGSLVALEKRGLLGRTTVDGEAGWEITAKGRATEELEI